MGHVIQVQYVLNEDLGLKSVSIDINTTDLNSDSELIKKLAITVLKALSMNKEDVMVQDLLNDLGIERTPNASK
jgi:hypothetical protein